MTNVLIFGASITWGAWDKEGGWVQRLRKFIDEKNITDSNYDCMVYNLGVSGDTTEWLLERFESETKARLGEEETIIIISIGANDSVFMNDKKKQRVELKEFEKNINKLIGITKKYSSKTVFVGLTPVDEEKVDPIPWVKEWSYKNNLIKTFNDKTKQVCEEKDVYFIEVYDKLIREDYKELLGDGVHPNSEGHERIFQIVKGYLIKNNIIK